MDGASVPDSEIWVRYPLIFDSDARLYVLVLTSAMS